METMEKEGRETWRYVRPLLVVPQFEDMINTPDTRVGVPPEPVANQIL